MRILSGRAATQHVEVLSRRSSQFSRVEPATQRIIDDVRRNGDRGLRRYAEKWDGLSPRGSIRLQEKTIQKAWACAPTNLRNSLRIAAKNIRQFCEWQTPKSWTRTAAGISLGQMVLPLDSVGCYVPGGRYPLASTVLMTVIPAQVAGVKNIRVASPQPRPEVLAAAGMLGIREFYRIGGAQAIAAFAYGTETVPQVDKIVGPGNSYVTAAKKLVSFDCAIDFLAGPTEILVVSDQGNPEFIAADLVAQAEHDPEVLAVFITSSEKLATEVAERCRLFCDNNVTAQQALKKHGAVLIADSRQESLDWANKLAFEHITIDAKDLPLIRSAGSIFIGDYSPQAAGDYASGPNHVLPTAGGARFRGGLNVLDFVKIIAVQELSARALRRLAPAIECLAETEGLVAHAKSISRRSSHA